MCYKLNAVKRNEFFTDVLGGSPGDTLIQTPDFQPPESTFLLFPAASVWPFVIGRGNEVNTVCAAYFPSVCVAGLGQPRGRIDAVGSSESSHHTSVPFFTVYGIRMTEMGPEGPEREASGLHGKNQRFVGTLCLQHRVTEPSIVPVSSEPHRQGFKPVLGSRRGVCEEQECCGREAASHPPPQGCGNGPLEASRR